MAAATPPQPDPAVAAAAAAEVRSEQGILVYQATYAMHIISSGQLDAVGFLPPPLALVLVLRAQQFGTKIEASRHDVLYI